MKFESIYYPSVQNALHNGCNGKWIPTPRQFVDFLKFAISCKLISCNIFREYISELKQNCYTLRLHNVSITEACFLPVVIFPEIRGRLALCAVLDNHSDSIFLHKTDQSNGNKTIQNTVNDCLLQFNTKCKTQKIVCQCISDV